MCCHTMQVTAVGQGPTIQHAIQQLRHTLMPLLVTTMLLLLLLLLLGCPGTPFAVLQLRRAKVHHW